jgi:hypothetical protein
VTEASGIRADGYGVGVAAADYDNDGWVDILLTNFGPNQLWRNKGDGTFEEVIGAAGIDDPRWNSGATFVDFDRDGGLDLFVGCYLAFTYENHKICRLPSGIPGYCAPESYSAVSNRLYRNRGDGTFEDRSLKSGVQHESGKALGVMAADFNLDGWMDIYVANDNIPNHMWINRGDGTFVNDAMFSGTAVNADGRSESSMGVDAADFDLDGDEDLFMTHLGSQTNTLYINDGTGLFDDTTTSSGLGPPSVSRTSWGVRFFDYDNDGLLDLMTASGDVFVIEALVRKGDPFPMSQPNQLFRNIGSNRFEDVTATAGSVFELLEVSRGLAFGDVDNDGDTDVLLENCNGRAQPLDRSAARGRRSPARPDRRLGRGPPQGQARSMETGPHRWRLCIRQRSKVALRSWERRDRRSGGGPLARRGGGGMARHRRRSLHHPDQGGRFDGKERGVTVWRPCGDRWSLLWRSCWFSRRRRWSGRN